MSGKDRALHNPWTQIARRYRRLPGMHAAGRKTETETTETIAGVHPDIKIAATIAVILSIPIAVTLTALIVQLLTYDGLWTWLPWVPPDNVL